MRCERLAPWVMAVALVSLSAIMFSVPARAQGDAWWIVRAEYGTVNRHNDVTDLVKDLLARGGVNGQLAVNNQTMGGDPAVGADKKLRIIARNARNEEREFDYREGSFVPVGMFTVRRDRDDWDDRGPGYRGHERRDHDGGVQIVRAYWGVQGRTADVTEFVRSRVREGSVSFVVSNRNLGGDPAIGTDKVLIVIYQYRGMETAAAVNEGNTLTLP